MTASTKPSEEGEKRNIIFFKARTPAGDKRIIDPLKNRTKQNKKRKIALYCHTYAVFLESLHILLQLSRKGEHFSGPSPLLRGHGCFRGHVKPGPPLSRPAPLPPPLTPPPPPPPPPPKSYDF